MGVANMAVCRWGALAFSLMLFIAHGWAQSPARPSVEDFFKPAKMQSAAMSPSGRWLAALTNVPGKPKGLLIIDLDDTANASFLPVSDKEDLLWFRWVSDDWLIGGLRTADNRSTQGKWDGMLSFKRDGSVIRQLISRTFNAESMYFRRRAPGPEHDFLAVGAPGTDEIIVGESIFQINGRELERVVPKVLNVATSALRTLVLDGPEATGWAFDHRGRARLAFNTANGITSVWWADTQGRWKLLRKTPELESPWKAVTTDGDDGLLVSTIAPGDGSMEIRRFDFASGAPGKDPLLTTPGFDGGAWPYRLRDGGQLVGLGVTTDAYGAVWFTDEMRAIQALVDNKLPRTVNALSCEPCDGKSRLLIFSYSDVDPGTYSLYFPQTRLWKVLGPVRPEIDPRRMGRLEMFRFAARDGRSIPVWITMPRLVAGHEIEPAPAVVLVHGGPHIRGKSFRFDSEAQFLASRGYVVIEPEFRGSEGYGEEHFRAGWKQWGLKMQDDISDSLKFAVSKGWADGSRACIVGASFGGYATLMGLAKDPDQYRCGVAFAGVADPRFLFDFHWSDITASARRHTLPVVLGDRVNDDALFKAGSPLEQVHRFKAPLLLMHGALDRRVPIDNAERMLSALQAAGKPVQWVRFADAGHGFEFDKDRYDYYRRIQAFLAQHLQP